MRWLSILALGIFCFVSGSVRAQAETLCKMGLKFEINTDGAGKPLAPGVEAAFNEDPECWGPQYQNAKHFAVMFNLVNGIPEGETRIAKLGELFTWPYPRRVYDPFVMLTLRQTATSKPATQTATPTVPNVDLKGPWYEGAVISTVDLKGRWYLEKTRGGGS